MLCFLQECFEHVMGRRKFRLSTRKNKERKQYQKRLTIAHDTVSDDDIGELVVRLPISAYLSAKTSSFHALCDKMKNSDIIHNSGWTCTGISHNILQKSFASQDISVTILPDYKFIVKIGDYRLDDCSSIPTTEVTSLSLIMELLGIIDNSSLCEGNPDTKFESAQKRRNGKFLSNSGMN